MACSFCLYGPKSNGLYCKGRQQRNGLGRINSYLYCRQLLYQRTVTEKKIQVIRLLLLILFLICVIYFLDPRITYVFFCSHLFPVNEYFFMLKVSDWSKEYKPESKIIMDIPSALNFFLINVEHTRNCISLKTRALIKEWNDTYVGQSLEVSVNPCANLLL